MSSSALAYRLDPWNVSELDFPSRGSDLQKLKFMLQYAVLAPSSHNSQPWLFSLMEDAVELYADRQRSLPRTDPEDRELIMSCGAALLFLRVALHHFTYTGEVEHFPEPHDQNLLARVRLGGREVPSPENEELFHAIDKRRTNRQPFERWKVAAALVNGLESAAEAEGAWFRDVRDQEERDAVAALVAEGDRAQMSDRTFRLELAAWMRPNLSGSNDGIPGYGLGLGNLASYAGPLLVRTFDMGERRAARDHEIAEGSPLLAVLATDYDRPADWLTAGQALGRVLLRARADGVSASYLNRPIEVAELRPRLRDALGLAGFPQVLLRLGYGADPRPTPRRPLEEVLI